jgi:hypothetical protein
MRRFARFAITLAAGSIAIACHRDTTAPGPPGITILAGAGIVDTIDAPLPEGLTIEVRDDAGELRPGVVVRFEAQPPDVPARRGEVAVHVCSVDSPIGCQYMTSAFAVDTTDDRGRAYAAGRLGRVATRAVVRIHVPELGLVDSVEFTVQPGNAARIRAGVIDTAIVVGVPAVLPAGHVVDRAENTRPETTTLSLFVTQNLTLDPVTRTVTGNDIGTHFIRVESGTLQPDVMMIRTLPPGRLVVWSSVLREVRLVNTDGTDTRVIATGVATDLGVFPRFDATRRVVTMLDGTGPFTTPPVQIVVTDTAGTPREVLPAPTSQAPTGISSSVSSRSPAVRRPCSRPTRAHRAGHRTAIALHTSSWRTRSSLSTAGSRSSTPMVRANARWAQRTPSTPESVGRPTASTSSADRGLGSCGSCAWGTAPK